MNILKEKELLCSSEELMGRPGSEVVPMRLFNTLAGSTVIGIVMEESADSFLVAFPSRLLSTEGDLHIEPYLPVPYARFFKSTILNMTPILLEFEIKYVEYVLKVKEEFFPKLFSKRELNFLQKRLTELQKTVTATDFKADKNKDDNINGTESSGTIFINSGSKYKH